MCLTELRAGFHRDWTHSSEFATFEFWTQMRLSHAALAPQVAQEVNVFLSRLRESPIFSNLQAFPDRLTPTDSQLTADSVRAAIVGTPHAQWMAFEPYGLTRNTVESSRIRTFIDDRRNALADLNDTGSQFDLFTGDRLPDRLPSDVEEDRIRIIGEIDRAERDLQTREREFQASAPPWTFADCRTNAAGAMTCYSMSIHDLTSAQSITAEAVITANIGRPPENERAYIARRMRVARNRCR